MPGLSGTSSHFKIYIPEMPRLGAAATAVGEECLAGRGGRNAGLVTSPLRTETDLSIVTGDFISWASLASRGW